MKNTQKNQELSELSRGAGKGVKTAAVQAADDVQKPSDEMGVRVLQEQEQTKEQQKLLSECLDEVFP